MTTPYDPDADIDVRRGNVSPSWYLKGPVASGTPVIPLALLTCRQALYTPYGEVVFEPGLVTLKSADETEFRCLWLPTETATLTPGATYIWVAELEGTGAVVPPYRYERQRKLRVLSELLVAQ